MLLISHRGNVNGRIPSLENTVPYLKEAVDQGFMVEVDVIEYQGSLYLGHEIEECSKRLTLEDVDSIGHKNIIFHAKNVRAASSLTNWKEILHFFGHSNDDFVASSQGLIIAHSRLGYAHNTVCMLPEIHGLHKNELKGCSGICSDIISFYA